jgi:hypothetical protein
MATTNSNGNVDLSFSNPDLSRPAYSEANANIAGTSILTTITLIGNYILSNASAEVSLSNKTNGTCVISFNAKDGANYKATITNINLGIEDVAFSNAVKVYPNPAMEKLYLEIGSEFNTNSISIYNIAGQQVLNQQIEQDTNKHVININNLAKGTYLMKITSDKSSITKLFIKK